MGCQIPRVSRNPRRRYAVEPRIARLITVCLCLLSQLTPMKGLRHRPLVSQFRRLSTTRPSPETPDEELRRLHVGKRALILSPTLAIAFFRDCRCSTENATHSTNSFLIPLSSLD